MPFDKNNVADLLPDRKIDSNFNVEDARQTNFEAEEQRVERKMSAVELARIKSRAFSEKANKLKYDGYTSCTDYKNNLANECKEAESVALKAAESKSKVVVLNKGEASLTGTTRPEVIKMLASLNINLNMQLTKTDTLNLLATLLTCNESQLNALAKNNKVPIAVKIIIKRLLDDLKLGNVQTVEMLWNRIFGAGPLNTGTQPAAGAGAAFNGIIPNQPVSREAYLLIRETLIGKE